MRLNDWKAFNDSLIENRIAFRVEKTTFGVKFFTPLGDYSFFEKSSPVPMSELWFIQKVKKYAEKLSLVFNVDRSRINYLRTDNLSEGYKCENVYEVDISSAYWNFAHREGIISDEIFSIQDRVSKVTRLAALGSLAKLTYNLKYNGEGWKYGATTEAPKADYFFRVAELTGEVTGEMEMISGDDFIFSWVDAAFVFPESLSIVCELLKSKGLGFSIYKIDSIEVVKGVAKVCSKEWQEKKKEKTPERLFCLKKPAFDFLEKHHKKQRKKTNKKTTFAKTKTETT